MICKKPFMVGVIPAPCGQCNPCRIKRRKLWSYRLLLESLKHGDNCFVTLTYDDAHLPKDGSVDPRELQLFLKKLRKAVYPRKIRYYAVGEYGDETQRPHYHAVLFGYPTCLRGKTEHRLKTCCTVCDTVRVAWGNGGCDLGEFNLKSAAYVCGYVTKKMTKVLDPRLKGRHPEFARMSLKPGIGADAMDDVAAVVGSEFGLDKVLAEGDVPSVLHFGRKFLPLGRYLRRKLREKVGFANGDAPKDSSKRFAAEMRVLLQEAFRDAENAPKTVGKILVDMNKQKVLNLESRTKIYSGRKTL